MPKDLCERCPPCGHRPPAAVLQAGTAIGRPPRHRVRLAPVPGHPGELAAIGGFGYFLRDRPAARASGLRLATLRSVVEPPQTEPEGEPEAPSSREEFLQRRLTRARFALGGLGLLVAVCVVPVSTTVWYWLTYLLGPSG